MSLVLLFHYLLLNMFRMLVHPSSGACDILWIYFMCCIALVRCVLVLVWFGWGGVVSLYRLQPAKKNLYDSSRLDVVEIARVPDMLPSLFLSYSG